jgi:hypothetical protein
MRTKVFYKFGLVIVVPEYDYNDFLIYDSFKISKKGLLIGYWDHINHYRDYLGYLDNDLILLRRYKCVLIFKKKK